jgi:23S rRNA (cytosine1962-C5)-methyltransferase
MSRVATLKLPSRLESVLMNGHPWIYRDQLGDTRDLEHGSWVRLVADRFEAYALYDATSALALRVYSRERVPDAAFFNKRILEAWLARESLRNPVGKNDGETSAFRWVFGEGDSLPGLIVDYYAGFAVIVCDTNALEPHLPAIVKALEQATELKGVLLRRRHNTEGTRVEVLSGRAPGNQLVVLEHGLRLVANVFDGQKTGLFLDHRENRHSLESWARGRRVLNLFSYTGAFSLYAARGGAARIVSVDYAPEAARDAAENFRLNGFATEAHEFVVADVFEYLEKARVRGETFDLIICDPPSFGRNQEQLKKSLAAYTRVNAAGLKVTAPEALYAAASCTSRVSPVLFTQCVAESARRALRRYQIILETGHALDHPVNAGHAEGRYLKFLLGRVSPRV